MLLSSTTDDSSAPSSLFDHKPHEESKTSTFFAELKKLYCNISALEMKILTDSGEPQDDSRLVIKGGPSIRTEDTEKARWKKATNDHKKYVVPLFNLYTLITIACSLFELVLRLLKISLALGVPTSLCNIPNIIICLWENCFYRLLENLQWCSLNSGIVLEYLQAFIYYAYTFYTALQERETFRDYQPGL
jgi:protein SMG6